MLCLRTDWKNVLVRKQNAKDTETARNVLGITRTHCLDVKEKEVEFFASQAKSEFIV
jgi:hypothetical protein